MFSVLRVCVFVCVCGTHWYDGVRGAYVLVCVHSSVFRGCLCAKGAVGELLEVSLIERDVFGQSACERERARDVF